MGISQANNSKFAFFCSDIVKNMFFIRKFLFFKKFLTLQAIFVKFYIGGI